MTSASSSWSTDVWHESQRSTSWAVPESCSTRSIRASLSVGGSGPRPSRPAARISSVNNAFPSLRCQIRSSRPGSGAAARMPSSCSASSSRVNAGNSTCRVIRVARELGEQRPQRMPAVELVGAVGADHHEPLAAEGARQEAEEMSGLSCRPNAGPLSRAAPAAPPRGPPARRAAPRRRQACEASAPATRSPNPGRPPRAQPAAGSGRASRAAWPSRSSGPERAEQRGIGQLALAELDAVADQHERVARARPAEQLVQQARLADAGLARHQHERRPTAGSVVQRGLQLRELAGPSDEAGACHSGGHVGLTILPPHGASVALRSRRDIGNSPTCKPYLDEGRAVRFLPPPEADPQHARQHILDVRALEDG